MFVILSHGRGGSSKDDLIVELTEVCKGLNIPYHAVDDQDCQNPEIRTERLKELVNQKVSENISHIVLMGFSMGGYCSVLAAEEIREVRGLFLIAPGLYLPRYQKRQYKTDLLNVEVIHGWSDDIVLYEHSVRFAQKTGATLHLMPGTHMLRSQHERIKEIFSSYLTKNNL